MSDTDVRTIVIERDDLCLILHLLGQLSKPSKLKEYLLTNFDKDEVFVLFRPEDKKGTARLTWYNKSRDDVRMV